MSGRQYREITDEIVANIVDNFVNITGNKIEPMTHPKDQFVRANGITMRCRIEGPESAQVILFSNSLATNLAMWDAQAAEFSSQYRVIRYDTRGHGQTETTAPPYSLSLLVEDARSLLDALGVERVHFVGVSLGGMVGQLFAVRYPQRLHSLVLSDTAARMKREIWEKRISEVAEQGVETVVEGSVDRWFTTPFRKSNSILIDGVRQMIRTTTKDGYVGAASVVMNMDGVEDLARIATPTLVVVGEEDVSTPPSESELLCERIAGASMTVVTGAAHLPNMEQPSKFNELLDEFLHDRVQSCRSQGQCAGM